MNVEIVPAKIEDADALTAIQPASIMSDQELLEKMYVKNDSLTTRIGLHDKYSMNHYGFANWIFDLYTFRNEMKVLELGCGTAGIWQNRNNRLPKSLQIVLSDFSPLMIQKAKDLLKNEHMFSFQQIDIQDIPFDNDTFDMVIANHMLYHVPDKNKALSEVRRVLKPDGCFYASTLGELSLKELNDIYQKLDDKVSFSYTRSISFTLENGGVLLDKYFGHVEQLQYIDSLEVTDIDDLIAYIKSYNDVPDSASDELYQLVSESFIDGVFMIRKEQGIFICTN